MDWKNFFWATKEKTLLTLGLFVLLNVLFFPMLENPLCALCLPAESGIECPACPPFTHFGNILEFFSGRATIVGVDLSWEIIYLGLSFFAACTVFHKMKKGKKA